MTAHKSLSGPRDERRSPAALLVCVFPRVGAQPDASRLGRRRVRVVGAVLMIFAGIVFAARGYLFLSLITATIGAAVSPSLAGLLLSHAALRDAPFLWAGSLRIVYDLLLDRSFGIPRPPGERTE